MIRAAGPQKVCVSTPPAVHGVVLLQAEILRGSLARVLLPVLVVTRR